jgi:glycosyltransferase involved in cell wall biosynthesis
MSTSGDRKITYCVVMPARNTGSMVGDVLDGLSPETLARLSRLVLLDNASTDDTLDRIRSFVAARPSLADRTTVIANEVDIGYGGSIKRGFDEAVAGSCSHALIIHSDDQCDWDRTLTRLMDLAEAEQRPDVVLACRFLPGSDISDYSRLRRFGNSFFNVYTQVVTGLTIPDPGTAIIAIRTRILQDLPYGRCDSGFHFHPQLNLLLYEDKGITKSHTVLDWRDASKDNGFALLQYGLRLLRMLTSYGFRRRLLRRDPMRAFEAIIDDRG